MDPTTDERRFAGDFEPDLNDFFISTLATRKTKIVLGEKDAIHFDARVQQSDRVSFPHDWDEVGYLQANNDVREAVRNKIFASGYAHYQETGQFERRLGGYIPENWDEERYLSANIGARAAVAFGRYKSGYVHFAVHGEDSSLIGGLPPRDVFDRLRLQFPILDKLTFQANELLKMILSSTATYDSFATLFRQSEVSSFAPSGQRIWQGQQKVLDSIGGTGKFFRDYLWSANSGLWLPPPELAFCFANPVTGISMFDPFRYMLRQAYERGTDLRLFVTPLHTSIRMLINALGLQQKYEHWLSELVRINHEEADRANRPPLPLWDFSDVNVVTTEPIPAAVDLTPMKWFWEVSHYREATGDLILNRILGESEKVAPEYMNFGVPLDARNIQTHLQQSRQAMADWKNENPALFEIVENAKSIASRKSDQRAMVCE